MNKTHASIIAVLLVFLPGLVSAQTTGDGTALPPVVPASAEPATATKETEITSNAAKAHEPISGAFGIPLGERFEPSMVAKVLDEQEQTYHGADGVELKGTLFHVEPSLPDPSFQRYSVKTTDDGVIYAIQGEYQFEREQANNEQNKAKQSNVLRSTCKAAVMDLAKEMEARYGKPRGKDQSGQWFAFRQFSETTNKSLRILGNRCRSGIYSVIYTDNAITGKKKQTQQQNEDQPASGS